MTFQLYSIIFVTKFDRHILLIQPIYLQYHSKFEASFFIDFR